MAELTKKQADFCKAYIMNGENATQAAISAGYSMKTAHRIGAENIHKPAIQKELDRLRAELVEAEAEAGGITPERIIEEETYLATSNLIGALYAGSAIPVQPHELPEEIQRAVASFEVVERYDALGLIASRQYKYKLWDKGQALNRLERVFGMTKGEGGDLNVQVNVVTRFEEGDVSDD